MTAKPWLVVTVMAMMCLMPYQSVDLTNLSEDSVKSESSGNSHEILLMGNSYVASNSLHNLVDGVMNAASQPANVSALSGGGMLLSQHASNVATSGHQWNTTLNNGVWDWVVLQDQSQVPGLPRSDSYWTNSKDGAVELAEVIEDNGGETVLMMTWGRRAGDGANPWHGYNQRFSNFSNMQDELASGYLDYRDNITANGDTAWVAPVGLAFEHIHDKIVAEGGTPTNSGNTFYNLYTGDGSHPSLSGSYLSAAVIYATITGNDPVGLSHSTSLSNGLVLELQQAAAATVFNETSHLAYPWQLNNQNQLPPINLSAIPDGALAWEWVEQFGAVSDGLEISDVTVDHNGMVYVFGSTDQFISNFSVGPCEFPRKLVLFVMKLNPNGQCDWLSDVTTSQSGHYGGRPVATSIAHDLQGNLYATGYMYGGNSPKTYNFNSSNSTPISVNPSSNYHGFVAKINSQGEWQWVEDYANTKIKSVGVISQDKVILAGVNPVPKTGWNGESPFARLIDSNGNELWSEYVTIGADTLEDPTQSSAHQMTFSDLAIDSNGDIILTGDFWSNGYAYGNGARFNSYDFGNYNVHSENSNYGHRISFVAKIDSTGEWKWATTWDYSDNENHGFSVDVDTNDDVFIVGASYGNIEANNTFLNSGSNENGYVAKLSSNGSWIWLKGIDCSCTSSAYSVAVDVHDNALVTGTFSSPAQIGQIQLLPASGGADIYFAKIDGSGSWQFAIAAGSGQTDHPTSVYSDRGGNAYLTGKVNVGYTVYGEIQIQNRGNSGEDGFIARLASDYDFDQQADINDDDDDGDYIIDINDKCQFSPLGFESIAAFDHDSDGCRDIDEDDDDDDDTLNDTIDNCPKGMTGWISNNLTDFDNDGCMDALEDYDDDNDGFEDYEDYCSRIPGNSTMEFEKGCPDTDGDGRPDILDPFPNDASEWKDTDGDGVGDNSDAFPLDATQQYDTDGDTYGDEEFGNAGDSCPTVFGNSTIDRYGCLDSDGDGWSDEGDDFPNDPTEYLDSDSDGYPDSIDDFPFDPTQWKDSDGDGYGDNAQGNLGDAYPNDASRYADSDRDGIDDQADAFPYDPTQWEDADGDGMGDNPMGIGADKFPDDPTQWGDIDGDGYGDNITGNNPDAFPTDATQWSDIDGDGYGDNPAGRLYDQFPDNPTQWIDEDEDGLGDNPNGTDADPFLNDFDNDGYNDTIDILPRLASPGDLDADGCLDVDDAFEDNPLECLDSDGDGVGDNADADDDNDLVTDADEIRAGTDPLDPNDTPVDSFEIQIGEIGLGAWDLIGIFGGMPIFGWILFGFVTRNARCARYEEQLEKAESRDELEQVALKWEYSLMLRLLGPHQGIRLERIRSELDDKFENAENLMAMEEFEPMTDINQTPIVEAQHKAIPDIGSSPSIDAEADQIDENGYSWLIHEGKQWYRTNSESNWFEFES